MTYGDELTGGSPNRRSPLVLGLGLLAVTAAVLVALRLAQSPTSVAAKPSASASVSVHPSITAWAPGTVTLLPPLCGTTTDQPPCPTSTPAGVYASELSGLNVEHPFTMRLPDGWTSTTLEYGNGIDLGTPDRTTGFSILLSPRPASDASNAVALRYDAQGLSAAIAADPLVVSTSPVHTVVDGTTGWQIDVRLKSGTRADADCRATAACYPLFLQYASLVGRGRDVAAGAFPGRTVRMVFVDLPRDQSALFWTWDVRHAAEIDPVIASVHFCAADQGCPTVAEPYGQ